MRKPPRLYFSFRSPRSWLAVRQLTERWPEAPDVITFVPHWAPADGLRAALAEADSGFLDTPISRAKHEYLLVDTNRLVHRLGYRMVWPADMDVDWAVPHLAWLYAREQGRGWEFYQAAVRARWEEGENISDPAVLAGLATEAGIDPAGAVGAAADPGLREAAVQALASAYDDDIFAVPYFIVGRHRFWGLERLDGFLDALHTAGVRP
ncbi:DsbA family protein [Micromonospora sp. DR5-3]|uniref:2-hydroxychromene-2-carboxylate isomerase n=1 Tax=unclassified Micromonospora TaxID=2617518 RepID=UPI0011D61993|nr:MULTISPECIES: DsbA family protein [unclassified Micromonospora]MCW3816579.1 DsbA family protein [Micromonospora sp. DR5-3]TYC20230.1 disulfide bond formation protein DsbA [Micromonospora sp. MP36]